MAIKTTSFKSRLKGGQFEPDLGGQFAPDRGGQLRPDWGGHIERIFQDVIKTLEWLDEMKVNVVVRNIGLQSRPNGVKNPIWKMISSVMSSLYEMELENIKERTMVGRKVYVLNGGRLGRPEGTKETEKDFLEKPQTKEIIKNLKKGLTIKDICKIVDCSNKTIIKTKRLGNKHQLLV